MKQVSANFFGKPPPAGHVSVVRLLMWQPGVMEAATCRREGRCPFVLRKRKPNCLAINLVISCTFS